MQTRHSQMNNVKRLATGLAVATFVSCGGRTVVLDGERANDVDAADSAGNFTVPGVSVVAENQETAVQVVVDDERIYWRSRLPLGWSDTMPARYARIRSCSKADCKGTLVTYDSTTFDTSPNGQWVDFYDIAVGGGVVHWTKNAGTAGVALVGCATEGCVGAPRVVQGGAVDVIAADATHVFWGASNDSAILRRPIHGGTLAEAIALNQSSPSQIVVTERDVYWLAANRNDSTWSVRRVPKEGGAMPTTLDTHRYSGALAVDDAFVYWTACESNGAILRCPRAGCEGSPTTLIAEQTFPTELATDGHMMTWINVEERLTPHRVRGRVVRCQVETCAATVETWAVQDFAPDGISITLDRTDVYWAAQGRTPAGSGEGFYPNAAIYRHAK